MKIFALFHVKHFRRYSTYSIFMFHVKHKIVYFVLKKRLFHMKHMVSKSIFMCDIISVWLRGVWVMIVREITSLEELFKHSKNHFRIVLSSLSINHLRLWL